MTHHASYSHQVLWGNACLTWWLVSEAVWLFSSCLSYGLPRVEDPGERNSIKMNSEIAVPLTYFLSPTFFASFPPFFSIFLSLTQT